MDDLIEITNSALKRIEKKIKDKFQTPESYQVSCKRRKSSELENEIDTAGSSLRFLNKSINSQEKFYKQEDDICYSTSDIDSVRGEVDQSVQVLSKASEYKRKQDFMGSVSLGSELLSTWETLTLTDVVEGFYANWRSEEYLIKNHAFLHSVWQKLHTGHWSEVPLELRTAFSWGSITLVGFLLRNLLGDSQDGSESRESFQKKALRVVQACDRGLLMGRPLEENPLHEVASLLNGAAMGVLKEGEKLPHNNIPHPPPLPTDIPPEEAVPFAGITPLETRRLPSLQQFLLSHMEGQLPLKIFGVADAWPALSKWDLNYFRRVAGARTVPVEVGLRYSDSDWSQTLMTLDHYLTTYLSGDGISGPKQKRAYLAQHQLFDQIPELLSDITVPDYCHMGTKDPVVNAWLGPQGTVTPLHHDPDHNILVQVYGYKVILIFSESDSKYMYAFDDELLNNTSRVNLEEEIKREDLFEVWPLLKEVTGHYLTLGPGDALYLPPRWWHYVRSLSNSISVSFWWR